MSRFDGQDPSRAEHEWRAQVHASATQKLAQALAAQQAVRPSSSTAEFQQNLSQVIQQLAHEEMVLIESMTGMDLLDKLQAAESGKTMLLTSDQAQQAGAFVEDALDDQAASDASGDKDSSQEQDLEGPAS
jgi:PleD family two-component response regulator